MPAIITGCGRSGPCGRGGRGALLGACAKARREGCAYAQLWFDVGSSAEGGRADGRDTAPRTLATGWSEAALCIIRDEERANVLIAVRSPGRSPEPRGAQGDEGPRAAGVADSAGDRKPKTRASLAETQACSSLPVLVCISPRPKALILSTSQLINQRVG